MQLSDALVALLGYGLFPVWLVAGLGDWLCHRRTNIERTSGQRESLLHLAQAAQLAPALLAVVFLEIDAAVLALVVACVAIHTFTAYWDLRFTTGRRHISPMEQVIHSLLLLLPVFAALLLCLLYWPESGTRGQWRPMLKASPLTPLHLALILGGVTVFNLLPLAEELRRTRRATTGN